MAKHGGNRGKNGNKRVHICEYCKCKNTELTPILYVGPTGKKKNAWKCVIDCRG